MNRKRLFDIFGFLIAIILAGKKLVYAGETSKAVEKVRELADLFNRSTGDKAIIARYPSYREKAIEQRKILLFNVNKL